MGPEKFFIEGTIDDINKQLGDFRRDLHAFKIGTPTSHVAETKDGKRNWLMVPIHLTRDYYKN